ncbi:hypothetical protein YC2023_077216 [Brassica napus]
MHLVHLALMSHLALESASGTFGADGASGKSGAETRIWYIWHLKVHLVHLLLGGFKSRRWMLHHVHHTDSVASRALHQVIMDVTSDRGLRPMRIKSNRVTWFLYAKSHFASILHMQCRWISDLSLGFYTVIWGKSREDLTRTVAGSE